MSEHDDPRGNSVPRTSWLRRSVEWLSRGRTLRRRLPAAVGATRLLVSPDAALSLVRPGEAAFDPVLLRTLREFVRPGACVWDVGANVGIAAFASANLAGEGGKVVAVEADCWLVTLLRRTALMPDYAGRDITIIPAAASREVGLATFCIARRGRAANYLASAGGRNPAGGVRESQTVPTLPLDLLLRTHRGPDVLKIDVEGAELGVLEGAAEVFARHRPVVIIEVERDVEAVSQLLLGHGYELFDLEATPEQRRPLGACVFNTLALPRAT